MGGASKHWRFTHNFMHHKYTNILGMDDDVGYGVIRVTRDQRWKPMNVLNLFFNTLLAVGFERMGAHRIFASLTPENTASVRLCLRLGMREEAHFVEDMFIKGRWEDTGIYGMLDRSLAGARARGHWDGTAEIIGRGREKIVEEMKASGLRGRMKSSIFCAVATSTLPG